MKLPALPRGNAGPPISKDVEADDRQMAELLERYADTSLSPDGETLARIGATVRAAFVEASIQRAEGGPAAAADETATTRNFHRHSRWSWNRRRAFAAICAAAVLALSSVGFAAAESGPGQPFYRLRLGIEAVNLPPAGSQDRLGADLSRADARLDEVSAAAAGQNWNGAGDAASAYQEVIAGLSLPSDTTATAYSRLEAQLARLEALRARSKPPETAQLDAAIATLCGLLGIPVPSLPAGPTSEPTLHGKDHESPGDTAEVSATNPDELGSAEPSGSAGPGQSGDSDGGRNHQSPSPSPSLTSTATSRWTAQPSYEGLVDQGRQRGLPIRLAVTGTTVD
jgi:hypothetical protein